MNPSRLSSARPTTRRERLERERELKNKIEISPKKTKEEIIRGMLMRVIVKIMLLVLLLALAFYIIK